MLKETEGKTDKMNEKMENFRGVGFKKESSGHFSIKKYDI